jgi:hypothetical protein
MGANITPVWGDFRFSPASALPGGSANGARVNSPGRNAAKPCVLNPHASRPERPAEAALHGKFSLTSGHFRLSTPSRVSPRSPHPRECRARRNPPRGSRRLLKSPTLDQHRLVAVTKETNPLFAMPGVESSRKGGRWGSTLPIRYRQELRQRKIPSLILSLTAVGDSPTDAPGTSRLENEDRSFNAVWMPGALAPRAASFIFRCRPPAAALPWLFPFRFVFGARYSRRGRPRLPSVRHCQ